MEDQLQAQDVSQVASPPIPEGYVSKDRVNELIKHEKALAAEKARREMEALYAQQRPTEAPPSQMGGGQSDAELEDKIFNRMLQKAQEMEQMEQKKVEEQKLREQQAEIERAAQQLFVKIEDGKKRIPDFEQSLDGFEIGAFPTASILAGQHENAPEILMEFARNPEKAIRIEELHRRSPGMAAKEIEKLSKSILQNQQAIENHISTNPPLSKLKPSSSVGVDSGKYTLKDLKSASWLRG